MAKPLPDNPKILPKQYLSNSRSSICYDRLLPSCCSHTTHFRYSPQTNLNGRDTYWPRGKVLGGTRYVFLVSSPLREFIWSRRSSSTNALIYDRCPPSSTYALTDSAAPLPILAAPAVELASHPPKRITFQLTAETPSDLLHEGSILHLAYALSGLSGRPELAMDAAKKQFVVGEVLLYC